MICAAQVRQPAVGKLKRVLSKEKASGLKT